MSTAAVLGTGQTRHTSRRLDVSMAGLCREAIDEAMADAGVGWDDIDAIIVGKAPDLFEGVMIPEFMLADALGAVGKPLLRVHTAGSVGGSTAIAAASHVQSGRFRRVLALAWEKQSESNAMWGLSLPVPFAAPVGAGAGGHFAPHVRSYIETSGAPVDTGAKVVVKDRQAGARNPKAHLHQPDLTVEKVMAGQMLWDPIRYDETCPSSDGAAAIVIGDADAAHSVEAEGRGVAWIHATSMRTEAGTYSGRNHRSPLAGRDAAAALWAEAGIADPRAEIDVAEIYVPFSWFEPMWLENLGFCPAGDGWKLVAEGATAPDGDLPVNPSGGVLSSNPIGASGLIRFLEAARQVMGRADEHQVPGARLAFGHAYGGASQYFSMWVVGADEPERAAAPTDPTGPRA
ncbi:thiolase domain-containing protein [Dietzia sp.]|uniref:thiolase domain-containing protein n=1 Tax=Dietzia sp. TaxID=1871616 RepID=UPI002FD8D944